MFESGVWPLPRAPDASATPLSGPPARTASQLRQIGGWCAALLLMCGAILLVAASFVEITLRVIELGQPREAAGVWEAIRPGQ